MIVFTTLCLIYGIEKCFPKSSFWCYYNKKNYPDFYPNASQTDTMNLKEEIEKYDVIVLMRTETGLANLGWGFIDEAYDMFYSIGDSEI